MRLRSTLLNKIVQNCFMPRKTFPASGKKRRVRQTPQTAAPSKVGFVTSSGKIVPAMLVRWKGNTPILRLRQNIRPALSSEQQALIDALGARKSLLEKGPLLFGSPEGKLWDSLDKQILGINPRPGMQRNLFAADPASVVFSKPASPTVVPVPQIESRRQSLISSVKRVLAMQLSPPRKLALLRKMGHYFNDLNQAEKAAAWAQTRLPKPKAKTQ